MTLPLTENFRANSYFKGFVINAIVGAIITVLAIELRLFLEDKTSSYYGFWSSIYKTKKIDESKKLFVSLLIVFVISILTYHIFFALFMFGGGFLINDFHDSHKPTVKNLFKVEHSNVKTKQNLNNSDKIIVLGSKKSKNKK
jgi:hypothetical protein